MELTGKCKEAFEKWYNVNLERMNYLDLYTDTFDERGFYKMPESMRWGVYVDFLNTKKYNGKPLFDYVFSIFFKLKIESQNHNDLVRQSISKSNELFNDGY